MSASLSAELAPLSPTPRYEVRFARTEAEVRATLRLRYQVFAQEMGAQIEGGDEGLDRDQYDSWCRHLMVRDSLSGEILACTRLLDARQAANAGGFYSASEFDLAMLDALPGRVLEVGRTCVAPAHRGGAVIALLWQGIAATITGEGFDYLFGCASIGLEDGGAQAHAILQQIRGKHLSPESQRVRPYYPLPAADARPAERARLPPLLKAYLNLGAKACGEPYWDRDFNCADVFMLLDVRDLNPRYARHFLGRGADSAAALALAA